LEQMINIAAPIIGKNVLELGRLTDKDIELAKSVLPSPDDKPSEIKAKIANLRTLLSQKYGKSDVSNNNLDSFRNQLKDNEELYYNPDSGDVIAVTKGESAPAGYERK
jgi:hypothetical protein